MQNLWVRETQTEGSDLSDFQRLDGTHLIITSHVLG